MVMQKDTTLKDLSYSNLKEKKSKLFKLREVIYKKKVTERELKNPCYGFMSQVTKNRNYHGLCLHEEFVFSNGFEVETVKY